jgi:ABC-2 type transport system ATP-binding protein
MNTESVREQNSGEAVIRVDGLVRRFKRKAALDGVSMQVHKGTVHGLVGENGAGKTTLMTHLLGGYRPQAGTVSIFGMDPVKSPVEVLGRLGYLSEERDIPGWMRVRELIWYCKSFYPAWDDAYAESLRVRFGLDPKTKIKSLSRGERAKAGLLCAIAYRPELLLLDEPSSGLDVASRRDILEAIVRTVADEGRTVVFSSHLLEEVERVADNITMLNRGSVVLDGPLDDIKANHGRVVLRYAEAQSQRPALPGVLFADGEGRDWTVIYQGDSEAFQHAAAQAHAEIVESATPTLEDIFLAHTGITAKGESAS